MIRSHPPAVLVAGLVLVGAGAPGARADTAAPVTVTVRADTSRPHAGDHVRYRIVVVNQSGTDFPAAVVAQIMPGGMRALAVGDGGRTVGGEVDWTVHLAPHGTLSRRVTTVVGTLRQLQRDQFIHVVQPHRQAKGGNEFSTTVCVRADADSGLLACGSDFLALQADKGHAVFWSGAAAVAAALGGTAFWMRKRKRRFARVAGIEG